MQNTDGYYNNTFLSPHLIQIDCTQPRIADATFAAILFSLHLRTR